MTDPEDPLDVLAKPLLTAVLVLAIVIPCALFLRGFLLGY